MKRILLSIIIILFSNNLNGINLFDSSFYEIQFISNNIENDKINKINKIKIESLLKIFDKTLSYNQYSNIENYVSEDFVNTLIKNIIINDEKIINNKYSSKIKINFDKKKIINFYREKKIPYIEYYPNKFLLIILEEEGVNENLFTKNNKLYSYLYSNPHLSSIYKLPNLDINDRFILKKEHIKNKNLEKINNFAKKYDLNEIAILLVEKENKNIKYNLILFSNDKIIEKRLSFNSYNFSQLFEILENEILNMWKEINLIQNKSLNRISCKINYFNMLELKEIKFNLNNISIIKDLIIRSIYYKNLEYEIYYFGNLEILINLFQLNNLSINNSQENCVIRLK